MYKSKNLLSFWGTGGCLLGSYLFDHQGLSIHANGVDVTEVQCELTELAQGQHLADDVLGDGVRRRLGFLLLTGNQHDLRVKKPEHLQGVVGVEVKTKTERGVLALLRVVFRLRSSLLGSDALVDACENVIGGFTEARINLSVREFQFQLGPFEEVQIVSTKDQRVTSGGTISFRGVGKRGELRVIVVRVREEGDQVVDNVGVHTVIDLLSVY